MCWSQIIGAKVGTALELTVCVKLDTVRLILTGLSMSSTTRKVVQQNEELFQGKHGTRHLVLSSPRLSDRQS